jgi:hypothetical protein
VRHAYPEDLTQVLRTQWDNPRGPAARAAMAAGCAPARLPDAPMREDLLSMCYLGSLLREEERPLRFCLILGEPARFAPELGPPMGFHRLLFSEERRCTEHELYRLPPRSIFIGRSLASGWSRGARAASGGWCIPGRVSQWLGPCPGEGTAVPGVRLRREGR